MSKKKILVFTGAGISVESGVETFRTDEKWFMVGLEKVKNDLKNKL